MFVRSFIQYFQSCWRHWDGSRDELDSRPSRLGPRLLPPPLLLLQGHPGRTSWAGPLPSGASGEHRAGGQPPAQSSTKQPRPGVRCTSQGIPGPQVQVPPCHCFSVSDLGPISGARFTYCAGPRDSSCDKMSYASRQRGWAPGSVSSVSCSVVVGYHMKFPCTSSIPESPDTSVATPRLLSGGSSMK